MVDFSLHVVRFIVENLQHLLIPKGELVLLVQFRFVLSLFLPFRVYGLLSSTCVVELRVSLNRLKFLTPLLFQFTAQKATEGSLCGPSQYTRLLATTAAMVVKPCADLLFSR